jgi:stage V sporulation protein K
MDESSDKSFNIGKGIAAGAAVTGAAALLALLATKAANRLTQTESSCVSGNLGNNSNIPGDKIKDANKIDSVLAEVSSLVGLKSVKHEVSNLISHVKTQQKRQVAGLSGYSLCNHMIFYGNPGTGKTTIARTIGRLMKEIGVLKRGHCVETSREGLVDKYVGHTALKTKKVLEQALGGVLFIDEAYTLVHGGENDFGQESVDTILKFMEDNRDQFILIVAGYQKGMTQFLESNEGLRSRFNRYLYFEDYTGTELATIFIDFADQSDYILTDAAKESVHKLFSDIYRERPESFGNARTVRNIFEKCIQRHSQRLDQIIDPTREQLCELIPEDIAMDTT